MRFQQLGPIHQTYWYQFDGHLNNISSLSTFPCPLLSVIMYTSVFLMRLRISSFWSRKTKSFQSICVACNKFFLASMLRFLVHFLFPTRNNCCLYYGQEQNTESRLYRCVNHDVSRVFPYRKETLLSVVVIVQFKPLMARCYLDRLYNNVICLLKTPNWPNSNSN
jgi:hypothetical protein